MMISCHDDDPIIPEEPRIIESVVVSEGADPKVDTTSVNPSGSGAAGTALAYQSWVTVKVKDNAGSTYDRTVKIDLKNIFKNVTGEQEVKSFDFDGEDPTSSLTYRVDASRKEQGCVDIVDSVAVYSAKYANGMSFDYDLMYEVPEYNDGVTKKKMPYYRVGEITEGELIIEPMDNETVDGKTYMRRLAKHSITVEFNGENYTLTANKVIKQEIKTDFLVEFKVAEDGYELVSYDPETAEGTYRSWANIEMVYSLSGVKTVQKEILLKHRVEFTEMSSYKNASTRYQEWNDFVIASKAYDPEEESVSTEDSITTKTISQVFVYKVTKTSDAEFEFSSRVAFYYEKANYDDGKITFDFPVPDFSEPEVSFDLIQNWDEDNQAICSFNATVRYGEAVYHGSHGCIFGIR